MTTYFDNWTASKVAYELKLAKYNLIHISKTKPKEVDVITYAAVLRAKVRILDDELGDRILLGEHESE